MRLRNYPLHAELDVRIRAAQQRRWLSGEWDWLVKYVRNIVEVRPTFTFSSKYRFPLGAKLLNHYLV